MKLNCDYLETIELKSLIVLSTILTEREHIPFDLTCVAVTHAGMTSAVFIRDVGGPFRHDSDLLVLWFVHCLTFIVFRAVHQTALAHANVRHLDLYSSLEVTPGGIQFVCDMLGCEETLQRNS